MESERGRAPSPPAKVVSLIRSLKSLCLHPLFLLSVVPEDVSLDYKSHTGRLRRTEGEGWEGVVSISSSTDASLAVSPE